jgi:hypothetical protein
VYQNTQHRKYFHHTLSRSTLKWCLGGRFAGSEHYVAQGLISNLLSNPLDVDRATHKQSATITRGRFKAIATSAARNPNFARNCVRMLGFYGIWIRDARYMFINRMVEQLARNKELFPIGTDAPKQDASPNITKRRNGELMMEFASGGAAFQFIKEQLEMWARQHPKNHWTELRDPTKWPTGKLEHNNTLPKSTTTADLAMALDTALQETVESIRSLHKVYEWRRTPADDDDISPWTDAARWTDINNDELKTTCYATYQY